MMTWASSQSAGIPALHKVDRPHETTACFYDCLDATPPPLMYVVKLVLYSS